MKRNLFYFLVVIVLMALNSCSSDNNNPEPKNVILPKTISYQDLNDPKENYTSSITYDGNKIVSIISTDGTKTIFTYADNLITKTEDFEGTKLTDRTVYVYDKEKLKEKLISEMISDTLPNGKNTKYVYSYDANWVYYTCYDVDVILKKETERSKGALVFQIENLVQNAEFYNVNNALGSENYTYDNKSNPFRNVLGINLLLDRDSSANNVLEYSYSSSSSTIQHKVFYSYEYDANGYPITQNYLGTDGVIKRILTIKY